MELEALKGIGKETIKILKKLNINSVNDLVHYYPFRYDVIKRSDINNLNQDDHIIMDGVVETIPYVVHFNKKMDKMSFKINTGTRILNVVIFNRGFLKRQLKVGSEITVIGKFDIKHSTIIANELRLGLLDDVSKIEPVYHITYGISIKQLSKYINSALDTDFNVTDYIPDELINKYNFINKKEAVINIQRPNNIELLNASRIRLKYEEMFLFMLKMNYLKQNKTIKVGLKREVDYKEVDKLINSLPYKLTEDQLKAVNDIYNDLIDQKRMNRLLQGDVGSGKTIVSFIGMYINYLSGYQSALMAPTEVLAIQHYENIIKLFKNYNIRISLLTGKMKAKEKKDIYKKLENNEIDIIIGTHALISDDVKYSNLGFVITDEQHRFGVNQRGNLKNKGITPDILYMSATPIPRTYALTLYGDMDISSIKTMPHGRKSVITCIKSENEMKDVLEKMYEELKKGHQIYVIAPLIEESDKSDLEDIKKIETNMNMAFGKLYKIGTMHGKLSGNEKDAIMDSFKQNDIQILISTTVIEVGVDVSNATMIVIYDAFKFGLSTLHQLRGRVGRSEIQSYCYLISNRDTERLKILTTTTDGFKVSEEDFRLRGSGDLFGSKQSGDMNFAVADIKKDFNILLKAKDDAKELLDKSFTLEQYPLLRHAIIEANNLD